MPRQLRCALLLVPLLVARASTAGPPASPAAVGTTSPASSPQSARVEPVATPRIAQPSLWLPSPFASAPSPTAASGPGPSSGPAPGPASTQASSRAVAPAAPPAPAADVRLIEKLMWIQRSNRRWPLAHRQIYQACLDARALASRGLGKAKILEQLAGEWSWVRDRHRLMHSFLGTSQTRARADESGEVQKQFNYLRAKLTYWYLLDIEGWQPQRLIGLWEVWEPRFIARVVELDPAGHGGSQKSFLSLVDFLAPFLHRTIDLEPPPGPMQGTPAAAPGSASPPTVTSSAAAAGRAARTGSGQGLPSSLALPAALLGMLAITGLTVILSRRPGGFLGAPAEMITALALLDAGRTEEALPLLQRAITRRTGSQDARCHLARCLVRLGQSDLALQVYREIDASKAGTQALHALAGELERAGRCQEALEIFARLYLFDASYQDVKARYEALKARLNVSGGSLTSATLGGSLPSNYTQIERLGQGGMGVVLKALDTKSQRTVAIKVIAPIVAADEAYQKRFRREVKTLALLTHPNIVRILEVQTEPVLCYAMEYVPGRNLRQILRDGPLPLDRVVEIGAQIAQALEYAHGQSVVHRDVKPENVLVDVDDLVKVVDFGLAFLSGGTRLTQEGQTPGTLLYMSPEQMKGPMVGTATDVYSLGLLLYEMVAGELPFTVETSLRRLQEEPPRLAGDGDDARALSDLVAECTRIDPDRRPTAGRAAARLHQLRARLTSPGPA